jgi:hypothetical protein
VTDAQPGHDPRESVAQWFVLQAIGCHALGSPFYGTLCELMAADARVGGPVFDVLGPHAAETFERVYQLRLMGGIHRIVLEGRAPELARHYPSVGGDGDIRAAWPTIRDLIAAQPPEVRDELTHPVQTNEVFRSTALLGGFLLVARDTGLPLRVLELGSSAGLNLRFDHYRYEQAGAAFGPAGSPVRFVDPWSGAMPPLDVARTVGAPIDRADLVDWLDVQLAEPRAGCATVVFHSIVWQYLTDDVRTAARARIESAGSMATADAPLAWLRLEPSGTGRIGKPELWLTQWPGGDERLLATASFQVGPVDWRG